MSKIPRRGGAWGNLIRPFACACALGVASVAGASVAVGSECLLKAASSTHTLALPGDLLPELHPLPDTHSALVITRSGWVLRVNMTRARITAQVRVSEVISAASLSAPRAGLPSLLAVANARPHTLVVLDEWLNPLKTLNLVDRSGGQPSTALGIQTAPTRQSFVLALKDAPEVWEISYNPQASEIGLGLVHDFQYREGQFLPGYLNPKRTLLDSLALDFVLVDDGQGVLTRHAPAQLLASHGVRLTHLDLRRQVAALPVPPWPGPVVPAALPWICTP